ncbi:integrase, partial [Streptomyces sp. NPDC056492]
MTNTELSVSASTTDRQVRVPAPARFDTATEDRLARLDAEATRHVEDARPKRTRDGYAADWRAWLRFCAEADLPPAAVRSGTLVAFVEWCWHQLARPPKPGTPPKKLTAPTTIDRPLFRRRRHRPPPAQAPAAAGRRRAGPRPAQGQDQGPGQNRGDARPRPRPALLVRHMEKVAAALPENRFGVRDLALMTLHFAIASRAHELAWLRVRDVAEDPEGRGLIVDVRVSKVAPRVVEVPYGSRAHICPVRAWRRWKEEAHFDDPDGFAFRRLHNRWGTVLQEGLDAETVGDILTRIGARADLDIRPTGHSPRGLVTESARAGNADAVMERQGGWAPGSK